MIKLTPKQYLDEFYPTIGYCRKTVINWIKRGLITGEQTPTGRWLVLVEEKKKSKATELLEMLEKGDL